MTRFTELVLTALQFQAKGLLTIGDILLSTPEETRRWFHHIPTEERRWFKENWVDMYRNRQQFHRTLNNLKRQGLITKSTDQRGSPWALTRIGKERNRQCGVRRRDPFSSAKIIFAKPAGSGITLVAYDIPEKDRRKRNWLRMCLVEMGCEKIQKSVWVAKGSIDEGFVHALRERHLLGNVHVLAVTREGTISQIVK